MVTAPMQAHSVAILHCRVQVVPQYLSPALLGGMRVRLHTLHPAPLSQIGALKTLQGHIWREGFASGKLVAQLFRDVPDALAEWRNAGIKTYIYSSGSREAQRNFFAYCQVCWVQCSCKSGIPRLGACQVLRIGYHGSPF